MGALCSSEPPSSGLRRETMLSTFRSTLDDWRITRDEADVLYESFDGADRSRDGYITQPEFLRMLNLKSSAFTKRIFGLFDANGNDEVDYGEFVTMCWSYMCMSKYAMVQLAFALYDADDSGDVEASEVAAMLGELEADPNFDTRMISDLSLDKVSAGERRSLRITLETFTCFALKFPSVLYPALRVQEDFRSKVGGAGFWSAICSRRAGGRGLDEIKAFQAALKVAVVQNQGLSEALNIIRDGRLGEKDLAPRKEAARVKLQHSQNFGRGNPSMLRQVSSLVGLGSKPPPRAKADEPSRRAGGGNRGGRKPPSKAGGGGGGGSAPPIKRGMTQRLLDAVRKTQAVSAVAKGAKGGGKVKPK
jgi:Ca2+-binding EF-hand superfamily protein